MIDICLHQVKGSHALKAQTFIQEKMLRFIFKYVQFVVFVVLLNIQIYSQLNANFKESFNYYNKK